MERFTPVLLEKIEQVKVKIHEAQQCEKDQIIQQAEENKAADRANKKAAKRAATKALQDRKGAKRRPISGASTTNGTQTRRRS